MEKEMVKAFHGYVSTDFENAINTWLEEKGQSIVITWVTSCGDRTKMVIIFYKYAHV